MSTVNQRYLQLDFTKHKPATIYSTPKEEFAPFARQITDYKKFEHNFVKTVKWSPDGTCLLSSSEDNFVKLFELIDLQTHTNQITILII